MSIKDTEVHLLNVPLDPTYKNQIKFTSEGSQQSYFSSCTKHSYNGLSYQRRGKNMKIGAIIDDLVDVNYAMYNNNGKWYYGFITAMEYVGELNTSLTFELDVYQTWLFNVTIMESFVMREHVAYDGVGSNLVDEGLETGEYIANSTIKNDDLLELYNVVAYSDGLEGVFGGYYSNVFSGARYRAFSKENSGGMLAFINSKVTIGKADSISMIFTIPKFFLSGVIEGADLPYDQIGNMLKQTILLNMLNIDGYVPKNNKLFTSPYNMLYVSNNKGGSAVYKLENFASNLVEFSIGGEVAPCPTAICVPNNYKGRDQNYEEMLTMGGFPLCSWNNDIYANWLAQNKTGLMLSVGGSVGAIIGGIATANPLVAGGGAMGVATQMSSIYSHSLQPDQAKGNTASGGVNVSFNMNTFFFSQMQIKSQYAERIDNFFEMYGYKINNKKIPELSSRPYWNYVKTIDINITGNIPQADMEELKNIYDFGVTLWHDGANVGNYNLNNH